MTAFFALLASGRRRAARVFGPWLLLGGIWNDAGSWQDGATWDDGV